MSCNNTHDYINDLCFLKENHKYRNNEYIPCITCDYWHCYDCNKCQNEFNIHCVECNRCISYNSEMCLHIKRFKCNFCLINNHHLYYINPITKKKFMDFYFGVRIDIYSWKTIKCKKGEALFILQNWFKKMIYINKLFKIIEWVEKKRMNPESNYIKKIINNFD